MKNVFVVAIWLIVFIKQLLFWLWLWQLKEYHRGRFKAHFEAQKIKKIVSSFWRLKYPKFTKKIIFLFFICFLTEILLILYFSFVWVIILTIIFIPLIFLSFQIPSAIWRKILINKAEEKRLKFKNLLVIGITGSFGKTSTKEFLAAILSEKFKVLKTREHQNSEVGVSQCILQELKQEHEIFVCEMAAYNRGGIKLICDIAKPKIGILTGINEQHMATFGSQEDIIKTKYELIESLPRSQPQVVLRGLPIDVMAFFNAKNKYCQELYERTPYQNKFGAGQAKIRKFLYGENATFFGEENILGAIAVAKELGMTEEEISKAVNKIENKFGGIQLKKRMNGINVIDATYSANPDGVIAHLEYLKTFSGKKIIVMPCLIELGKASKEVHRRISQKIAEVCDMAIITTKDRFKEIREEAGEKTIFMESPNKIFEKIKNFCQSGDVILLESRVPQELINLLGDEVFLHLHLRFLRKLGKGMNFFRPISISLSPNTEKDDILLALKLIFQPWKWKNGLIESGSLLLEEEFKRYLGVKYAISFNSGRSAFLAILESLELNKDEEVLIQAFTCNAAVNPILWAGLKPVYVDCDDGLTGSPFNIDIEDLKRKITQKSRVMVVQHTFGLPAEMDKILKICQKGEEDKSSSFPFADARENNLILIEDCAHSLGAEYKNRKVGTFGKAAFFSFSRDKVISSVYGGMAVTNDENLAKKIKDYQEEIDYPSFFWIKQQLLHPIFMNWLILPTYRIFGKYLLVLFQWLKIMSKAVHWKEKRGEKPCYFPKRMPNALAILALNQFKKLEKFNNHRKEIAGFYAKELSNIKYKIQNMIYEKGNIFLRFPIAHGKAHKIIKEAWNKNLLIGDWYTSPVAPHDTKLDKMNYISGTCPKAENLAKETLNLPTHINISKEEARKIIEFLKMCDESKDSSFTHRYRLGMEVKEVKEKNIWEDFLLGVEELRSSPPLLRSVCEEKTFLDSWNWGEFQKAMGNKIWRLGIYDNGGLTSVALASKVTAKRGTFLLIQHGPNLKNPKSEIQNPKQIQNYKFQILNTLSQKLKEIARDEKASFIRIAPLLERNEENIKIFKDLGLKEAPTHASAYESTWKLDIRPTEEELLINMRKTTRYLIRQAMKNQDITIEKSTNLDDVELYQKLNTQVAKRQNFVAFSSEYIKKEFEVFSKDNQVLLFFGKYQGEVAAAALVIFWQGIGFYHQAASDSKYAKFSIPYLLLWEAIKEAKRRGCILYDFWGFIDPERNPKHPWAGPTLFKMGFGGYEKEFVKTQDVPLSKLYWLTYIFEKIRKSRRGL